MISDVKLYNRGLNKTEIGINYNASPNHIVTGGLVSWWKMDEMGAYLNDSVNTNHGLIYGATWMNAAKHHYTAPGTYTVNLSVISEKGLTNHKTVEITIT